MTDTITDTTADLPPIQLLIAHVLSAEHDGDKHAWLHAFCLLTITPLADSVKLTGEVRLGHRYAENWELVQHLADALDPTAVLAGYDLDTAINRLGRLPIDARKPASALALLNKLEAMIDNQCCLDVGCTDDMRIMVHNSAIAHGLELHAELNQCSLEQLAIALSDKAGACVLALGECYIPEDLQPQLIAAWRHWHRNQMPVFPPAPVLAYP